MNEMHSLKLIILLNLVILCTQIQGRKACYEEERKGLLELKLKLVNGPEHALLPSWVDDPNNDCCGWERVTCNSTTGRVVLLSLFNMPDYHVLNTFFQCFDAADSSSYLNITLFESFKDLKALNLSYNCMKWVENQGLLRLEQLETLDLSFNRLTSVDIMRFLCSLPSLKSLDLSFNGMRGTLSNKDLIACGRLEELDLSHNQLEGSIPQNFGKLSSLKELYLAYNQFNSTLPIPGLCKLRRLQVLDIHDNSFEGALPPCISNFTSLAVFDLHDNLFSGTFTPNLIRSHKFLQFIDISNNYFEGSFSLGLIFNHSKLEVVVLESREDKLQIDNDDRAGVPLFQLKALRISHCNMKNTPRFLLNQHRLTRVDISHNKLTGAFPSWLLENNTDLTFLNLRNNSFSGELDLPTQYPRSSMGHLDVSYNHMEGHLPKDLGLILPNLHCLNLSYNFIEGELPSSIGAMRKLLLLVLSFNNLSGEVPKELAENCSLLLGLMLNDNNFHGAFFSNHFNLRNIQVLKLGNNEFTGSLITKKEFYGRMEIFDVSNNNMDGKIPNAIAAEVILLQNNSFEGQIPCGGFSGADVIDISHNFLSGPIPSCLSPEALSSVSLLNLRDNRLSGNIPAQIGMLPCLRILLLGNNRFNGSIPEQLCQLRNISIMDLSNNSFTGSIPSCLINVAFGTYPHDFFVQSTFSYWFSQEEFVPYIADFNQDIYDASSFWNSVQLEDEYVYKIDFVTKNNLLSYKGDILKCMSGLDLSCNNLTGLIPQSLGKLTSLHALNLSHNHLTGIIPVSLSNLSQVESLDFSYNNLSGKIPSELVHLNFLAVFSVAHNNLSGRVPDKGQFATFGFNSYEGNPLLSGLPSEKNGTGVVETPFPLDETEGKWYAVDPTSFFASFVATYCVFLLTLAAVLYINTYWRRRWSHFIEKFIYSFCFFVVDPLRKLTTNFKHHFFR
ncbi:receptor-like protein 15 isoform X1 [Hibiscus syriacus]|uniref:receptor-like protein 15 isoform X1 n=2 Tax=Hibiscus syriacus TaxID=106335 RepID=UPI001920E28E|nr:receptor-like protein 15 isoform X1 [Hibiscus syriacus]